MTDVSMADEISRMSAALAADKATADAFSLRETLAIACRILGNNGHGSGLAGQMTARGDNPTTMWTLPYGVGFEEAKVSDYVLVDKNFDVIEGSGRPSPANRFHIHVYATRPDVMSIVHTHPINCSALAMIGEPLRAEHMDTMFFYEDTAFLPHWPGVPFGDGEGEIISTALGDKSAILLAHHGQLCAGVTVEAACVMGVFIERAAELQLKAMAAGTIQSVTPELGQQAHGWRHDPGGIATTFRYFARQALKTGDDPLQ
ncbi:MAG: aldolase [Rhodospirillales bacterium]